MGKQLRGMQSVASGLHVMTDQMLQKEGIPFPPSPEVVSRIWGQKPPRGLTTSTIIPHIEPEKTFEEKTYDITNYQEAICTLLCTLCLSGWTSTKIHLGEDEMT